jgi:hypothetical protein
MINRILRRTAAAAGALALTLPAAAVAWETVPEIRMTVEGDDNVVLRADDVGWASRTVLDLRATLTNRNPRGHVFFEPRVVADTYLESEHRNLRTEDLHLRAGGQRRGERRAAGFRAIASRENLIRSEFADVFPEDPDLEIPIEDVGTGRLEFFGEDRTMYVAGGNLDFEMSERNRFRIDLQHRDVSYSRDGDLPVRRSAFDDSRLMMEIARRMDQNAQVSARLYVSQYNAERTDNTTDTVGVEAVLNRPLSEVWTLNLAAGMQRSDYSLLRDELDRVENVDTNMTLGLGLQKRAERSILSFYLGHRVDPSASGYLVVRDEARVSVDHEITQRLTTQIGVRLLRSRTLDDVSRIEDRNHARFQASFEWAMNPRLFLISGYRFTTQEFVREETRRADSNMVYLGMAYRGLSRGQGL